MMYQQFFWGGPRMADQTGDLNDDASFSRQRRNVLILSLILILFCSAGASIRKLPLGDAWIEFRRFDVLIGAAWVALLYSVFRFYLHADNAYKEFSRDYYHALSYSPVLLAYVKRRVANGDQARMDHLLANHYRPHVEATPFRREMLFASNMSVSVGKGKQREPVEGATRKLRLPLSVAWRAELEAFCRLAVRSPIVTELWVPYGLATTAITIGVVTSAWKLQGL
jgi:hypothetical protein